VAGARTGTYGSAAADHSGERRTRRRSGTRRVPGKTDRIRRSETPSQPRSLAFAFQRTRECERDGIARAIRRGDLRRESRIVVRSHDLEAIVDTERSVRRSDEFDGNRASQKK
jgi:hypothetical protein